ncbi:hypothetical protein N8996_07440 [Candidatus Poseidonia alphae]|nr:hypothetical protein [Candidatus Poseidonia alphae]
MNYKLVDLIEYAKTINYIEPSSQNSDEWSHDELVFKSIKIALDSDIQIKAGLHICNQFSPLKIIYKSILRQYINYFTSLNIQHNNNPLSNNI